jgi:hypothetical protein
MVGMGAEARTIVRAEAADYSCDCWAVKISHSASHTHSMAERLNTAKEDKTVAG